MTVAELIAELQAQNPDSLVVQSSDSEGNSIRNFHDISAGWFDQEPNDWEGEYEEQVEGDPETPPGVPCVCLWPAN